MQETWKESSIYMQQEVK